MSGRDEQFRKLYKDLRIDDQLDFYEKRGREYKQANQQAIVVRTVLLALAALAGLVAQLATGTGRAALGVVAALLAALAAAVTAYESLIGFTQLDKLYNDAALNLEAEGIGWMSAGPHDLEAELGKVEQIFSSENGQWGQLVIEGTPKEPAAGTATGQ